MTESVKTQDVIARNRAAREMVSALEILQVQTGEQLVRWIEPRGALRTAYRVTGENPNLTRKAEHSQVWDTISFFKDGRRHVAEVPAHYAAVGKGLGAEPDHVAIRIARALTQPLRLGATTYNPFFLPVNVMRDAMAGIFREKIIPFGPDYLAGLWAAIRKNKLFDDAAESGALMSGIIENMRTSSQNLERAKFRAQGALEVRNVGDALLLLPRLINEHNLVAERGLRIAAFRKAQRAGLSNLESAIRARDVSVDFSKAGHTMRVVNQIVPFSNAALQGSANIIRTVANHPKRSAAFGAMFASPAFLARVNNLRFETSSLIPDYEYTRNWVVQTGEGTRKDGTKFPIYIKIPKGEIAGIFSFPVEVFFNMARESEDRSAVEIILNAGRELLNTVTPIDVPFVGRGGPESVVDAVPFIGTTASVATNTNLFTGGPIIPQREESLPAERQFGPDTSAAAVAIGRQFNVSPRMIEFAVNDYTAGAGQSVTWALGMGLEALGYEPEAFGAVDEEPEPTPVESASNIPGIGRFFSTRDSRVDQRGWERLRRITSEANSQFLRIPGMNELGIQLGQVGGSVDLRPGERGGSVDLTPMQRADYQALMAGYVIPRMEQAAPSVVNSGLSRDKKRERIYSIMNDQKDVARNLAIRDIILPALRGESGGTATATATTTPVTPSGTSRGRIQVRKKAA